MRRSLAGALLLSAGLVGGTLGVVALRVQQVQLAYQLDALRAERVAAETRLRELEIEVAALRSPARLEERARRLGLGAPTREQVRLAREYVPAGTGLAAAHRSRVAATDERIPIR